MPGCILTASSSPRQSISRQAANSSSGRLFCNGSKKSLLTRQSCLNPRARGRHWLLKASTHSLQRVREHRPAQRPCLECTVPRGWTEGVVGPCLDGERAAALSDSRIRRARQEVADYPKPASPLALENQRRGSPSSKAEGVAWLMDGA